MRSRYPIRPRASSALTIRYDRQRRRLFVRGRDLRADMITVVGLGDQGLVPTDTMTILHTCVTTEITVVITARNVASLFGCG